MSVLRRLQELFPDGKVTSSRWYNICCPICSSKGYKQDTGFHFGINYKYGYTNCWKCRTRHKLTHFLSIVHAEYDKDDFTFEEEALRITKAIIKFPREYINILDMFDPKYPSYVEALAYIEKRIGLDLALKMNIGFCNTGKYANRIIVPMFDVGDNIIYFVGRSIYKHIEPKILNPFGERKSILFNWNIAQNFSEIYLAEGVFGALTMYPYGVAALGKEITDEQIMVILRSKVKIINILLDGSAMQEAYSVANKILSLTSKIKVRVLKLKPECQPDDLSFEHLLRLKGCTPFYVRSIFS